VVSTFQDLNVSYCNFPYSALACFRHLSRSVNGFLNFFDRLPNVSTGYPQEFTGFRCSGDGGQGSRAWRASQIFLLIIGNPSFQRECYANPFESQARTAAWWSRPLLRCCW